MRVNFDELDYQQTPLGELTLRRRQAVEADGREIFEVKLNEEYLMSSLFIEGEVALTNLGLAALTGDRWDVIVGGLGLGFTAAAVLDYAQVARLSVIEALKPVIDWHQQELVPNGARLSRDARCNFLHADFFDCVRQGRLRTAEPSHPVDAILLDIDHTPDALLNPSHADLYDEAGLTKLRSLIKPGGVFALWSNEAPDETFLASLSNVFDHAEGHRVTFANPIQGGTSINGVYVATRN
ncbi:MAG: spermidine synthase [Verrucomicrobia bacterium]|nr:spermidine synthase [Verrucomicrobiota bacterium]